MDINGKLIQNIIPVAYIHNRQDSPDMRVTLAAQQNHPDGPIIYLEVYSENEYHSVVCLWPELVATVENLQTILGNAPSDGGGS